VTGITERLSELRTRIGAALLRCGEPEREVTVLAVTKGHPAATVDQVAAAGLVEIGENRVAEAIEKAALVNHDVRWHMIGHLQRNKVKRAVTLFDCIHSVDSVRLARALGETEAPIEIFLEINVSGEAAKQGAAPESAREVRLEALRHPSLRTVGLMTMAPWTEDPESVRPVFRNLRALRDELNRLGDGPPLPLLSMGMSGDFEVAVEEGATHVRIGTALVGGIPGSTR